MNFNPEAKRIEPINALKNEHLNDGIKPIIGGIYDRNNLDRDTQIFLDNFKKDAEYINFGANQSELEKNKMLNSGKDTYIISPCDSSNKYSDGYQNCTGIIVSGVEKETGKNISLMTHQFPGWFLNKDNNNNEIKKFKSDLSISINELNNRCVAGSIDAVVFGGNKEDVAGSNLDEKFRHGYDDEDDYSKDSYDVYIKSIKTTKIVITEILGFSPIVISGPNDNLETKNNPLDSYYDNENKRLFIIKPKQSNSKNNEPFMASDVEKQINQIKNNNEK
jgi:hypothetical protein